MHDNILIIRSHTWLAPFWSLWLWAWIKECMCVCRFRALYYSNILQTLVNNHLHYFCFLSAIVQTCRKSNYVQCFDLIHILVNTWSHQFKGKQVVRWLKWKFLKVTFTAVRFTQCLFRQTENHVKLTVNNEKPMNKPVILWF